ncbi:VOC family protein [Luethyella okanaganae]|uniref:VOC family protein n=1 Tax=Luethyella okanaganae TaxID=69372 RepID=A0ABW1VJY3_9MICO
MFTPSAVFSGFSVRDVDEARRFYGETLGVATTEDMSGAFRIELGNGASVFAYGKENHEPASYTMLNIVVDDIDQAVAELETRGVSFLYYDGLDQDEHGISIGWPGPRIAWFADPSGNIISVLQPE